EKALGQAGYTVEQALKAAEGPAEKALAGRLQALVLRYDESIKLAHAVSHLKRVLGEPETREEEQEAEPLIAKGRTAAGETFIVRAERHSQTRRCRAPVSIEFQRPRQKNGLRGGASSSGQCAGEKLRRGLPGGCSGEIESFQVPVPPTVWAVRLLFGDGRTNTNRVVRTPRRDGGPTTIYVQSVHTRRAKPVSLTELDRNGRVITVRKVEPCVTHERRGPSPPYFVPLANAVTPQGEPFTIDASIFHPEPHQTEFGLSLYLGVTGFEGESETLVGGPRAKPKAYPWREAFECAPKPFSVVYGILAAPGDSVSARTATGLVALTKV